jgi:hypothetical protein
MCAGSKTKLGSDDVSLYLGYYGGRLTVGDKTFSNCENDKTVTFDEMVSVLAGLGADTLARMVVELVANGDEW